MNRRYFLTLAGMTLGASAVVGTVSASHVEDPYANEWEPAYSGNYDNDSRGTGYINWVVIHVGQGDYGSIVNTFQNPAANVSAHYVIRNSDGYAAQMVHHEDTAWHAGGQNYNTYSIGIEHGGYTDQTTFTEALYQKSANIVSWLCDTYDIPKEHPTDVAPCDPSSGGGIIGHHQVPEADCGPNDHTDPGSTWDWDHYMGLVTGGDGDDGGEEDGGDGGSGGATDIRLKGHRDTSYAFYTTGDINRYSTAEPHDENLHISGNDHDEIQGWVGGGNWDKFNFAGALAWIDTPSLYIDLDDDVIRFEGNAGSGKNAYSFHTTGDIDKLASADGNDDNQYIKGNDHDEIQGIVYAGHEDAFRFDDSLTWIDTPDLHIDIDP
jgi:N-acetyl-anhydromuramyl-L-alanine amidase AmpD